jgi:hydroxypyruvate reductase
MRKHDELEAIWRAGIEACLPERVIPPHLPEPPLGRTFVLALGKAAVPMARTFETHWEGRIRGLAVHPHHAHGSLDRIDSMGAGHPVPDEASVVAARNLLALASEAGDEDLVLVLLSGGASSLACLPGEGLYLEEKQTLTSALLRSGAPIGDVNSVRRHLSRFKGGRLAAAATPARLVTLAISDVPGDLPHDIGSGPTVADPTWMSEARSVLDRYRIEAPRRGWSESVKQVSGQYRIVARGRDALDAAAAKAAALGYRPHVIEAVGEAREAGRAHAAIALGLPGRSALISGGELSVTVTGSGTGGPNQEYALAAALELAGQNIRGIAADTDGKDGTSEAAGAYFDGDTASRAGRGAMKALESNDSHSCFAALGDLFVTGPTGTNVSDLRIILKD